MLFLDCKLYLSKYDINNLQFLTPFILISQTFGTEWGTTDPIFLGVLYKFNIFSSTNLFISHFCVNIYLILYALQLESIELVKHPFPSVIPDNQASFNEGET